MSGNLCRCSAYPNIVDAISEVARSAADDRTADEKDRAMADEVAA
jgi:xanthine dehydrogenase iron-sulfur cluster and FAD-binding subunit A